MITASYPLTATERVLPRLALDFTTGVLDPRVTVTRSLNTATRVNSSGLVEAVNANLPRFDYSPLTLASKGLLIEEARTNLLLQSSAFATSWTLLRATLSSDVAGIAAPDGTETADKLIDTAVNNSHYVLQGFTAVNGAHTVTVFAKSAEKTQIQIIAANGTTPRGRGFDLSTGQVFNESFGGIVNADLTCDMEDFGNGWWRCRMSWTADGQNQIWIALSDNGASGYLGNGTDGLYIWGAQLEAGAFATSYIPTTTTSLTRNKDDVTMTGTNFSSWFNAAEGSFAASFDSYPGAGGASPRVLTFSDATTANRIRTILSPSAYTMEVVSGGVTQASLSISSAGLFGADNKIAFSYKTDRFATSLNGSANQVDTSGAVPVTPIRLNIGSDYNGANTSQINGHIKKLSYWPQSLIGAEIQAFSKG